MQEQLAKCLTLVKDLLNVSCVFNMLSVGEYHRMV